MTEMMYVDYKGWNGVYRVKVERINADNPAVAVDVVHVPFRDLLAVRRQHSAGSYVGRVVRDAIARYRRQGKHGDMAQVYTGGMATVLVLDAIGTRV